MVVQLGWCGNGSDAGGEVVGERREDESKLMAVTECSEGGRSGLPLGRRPRGRRKWQLIMEQLGAASHGGVRR
jgi:hypothetical protein